MIVSKENQNRVLVVEDDELLARMLKTKLSGSGLIVDLAQNGEIGLQMAIKEKPDAIILDLLMPKMDGMTFLKTLRKDKWGEKAPVIIFTNLSASNKDLVHGVIEGAPVYYLIKSEWTPKDILEKVREIIQKNKVK